MLRRNLGKPRNKRQVSGIPKMLSREQAALVSKVFQKGIPFVKTWQAGGLKAAGFKTTIQTTEPMLAKFQGRQVIVVTYRTGVSSTSAIYSLGRKLLAVKCSGKKWRFF